MVFKINIADSGKTWKVETENEFFVGQSLNQIIPGKEVSEDLSGYEFNIQGASDIAGFPHKLDVEGSGLRRVLLTKGWGMHAKKKGLRLRKTVRGKQLSEKTVQINLTITMKGSKSLKEVFPDQNKEPEKPAEEKSSETPKTQEKELKSQEKSMEKIEDSMEKQTKDIKETESEIKKEEKEVKEMEKSIKESK